MTKIIFLGGVFLSSLLGSLHCVGMCGGFSLWAADVKGSLGYHLGRLLSYVSLVVVALVIGSSTISRLVPISVQQWIGVGLGGLLIINGVSSLLGTRIHGPKWWVNLFSRVSSPWLKNLQRFPRVQGVLIGALSVLLPCGWLYSFLIAAVATGQLQMGALVMLAFWLGTLPALVGGGMLWRRLDSTTRRRVAWLPGVMIVVIGVATIVSRYPDRDTTPTHCHGH